MIIDTSALVAILLDEAASVMLVHRDPDYIKAAGAKAASFLAENMKSK